LKKGPKNAATHRFKLPLFSSPECDKKPVKKQTWNFNLEKNDKIFFILIEF